MSAEDDMPGSAAANQSKTESMPPTEGHADPEAAPSPATVEVPSLDSMSVGAGDPQAPSHDHAGGRGDRANAGVPALPTRDVPPAETAAPGTASRTPGLLGATGPDEQVETDVVRSAAEVVGTPGTPGTASGPGDSQGVPVVSGEGAPGTSEESTEVEGARTPE